DYLQLMNATGLKLGSREQEVSTISRSLKALAKELNIPIIALSQLNRSTETREDKRPVLSDLRESGAIEQDADIVCFIHRPEYYTKSSEDAEGNDIRGLAQLIVAKHRSGAVGDVKLRFISKYAKFENWNDGYDAVQETLSQTPMKFGSKMNSDYTDATSPNMDMNPFNFGKPSGPMPDIMPGPDDSGVPF
ncbi:MAG: replicative DNA helicase, partial [Muribaculaceae bacterium]|nr:replicative DNA helicase [Muribaculaceae bacterium]